MLLEYLLSLTQVQPYTVFENHPKRLRSTISTIHHLGVRNPLPKFTDETFPAIFQYCELSSCVVKLHFQFVDWSVMLNLEP